MKHRLFLCLALMFLFCCCCRVMAAETVTNSLAWTNSPALMNLAKSGNFYGAEVFFYKQHGAFPPNDRNAVFLFAAQSLMTTNAAAALEFMGSMLDDYVTVSHGVKYQDHGITSEKAIPYLIDASKVEAGSEEIIGILRDLTRRNGGFANGGDLYFVKNPRAVIDWWRKWWRQNQNRHPVFDVGLEMLLRNEVLKLDEKIEQAGAGVPDKTGYLRWDSGAHFVLDKDGRMDSGQEWNDPNSVFTFYYGHCPGGGFKNGAYSPQMGDDVLSIRGEYLTKDLFSKSGQVYGTFLDKKFPMQEIFSEKVPGTGIGIKVEIVTKNEVLIETLKKRLKDE